MDTEKTEQASNGAAKTDTDQAKKPIIDQVTDQAAEAAGTLAEIAVKAD